MISKMQPLTIRQEPVAQSLSDTLDLAKAQARAILDNAMEDQLPFPADLLSSFNNDLCRIQGALESASCVKSNSDLTNQKSAF
tara:strand:+ start:179 stop:427 length:249 start_codon:yes stop_codon:yes gene_type:complete